jgi:trimeric autotransporter adhesin
MEYQFLSLVTILFTLFVLQGCEPVASEESSDCEATGSIEYSMPVITYEQIVDTVLEGTEQTFVVVAIGEKLEYQWQKNGVDLVTENYPTYQFEAFLLESGGSYRCIVSNSGGADTTTAVVVTVNRKLEAPTVTLDPLDLTVSSGDTALFTCEASGDSLSYQWQRNSLTIVGANSSSYHFITGDSDDGFIFRCIISNSAGADTTGSFIVLVNKAPIITQEPHDSTIYEGKYVSFDLAAVGDDCTYQWQKNGRNISEATFKEYQYLPLLLDNGSTFRCIVSNSVGSDTSRAAFLGVDAVIEPPKIIEEPVNPTVAIGDTITVQVVATGDYLHYQWQRNEVDVLGEKSASYSFVVTSSDHGIPFRCVVSNSVGTVTSIPVRLIIN